MTLKEHIIDESLKLFSLKGFYSTSLQDILAATGASKGGFYNHFKSKEELFFRVLDKARAIWREKNLAGLEQIPSAIGKIEKLLQNYKDNYLKDLRDFPGGCVFITLSVELNNQSPILFTEIDKGFVGLKNLVRRYLEQGQAKQEFSSKIDTEMVTEVIFNGMIGASVCYGANKSAPALDKAIGALTEFLSTILPH